MAERSLLIEHAAELLGLSRRTVYYRIREGRLRTVRTRCGSQRVLLSSIEALLREDMRVEQERRAAITRRRVRPADVVSPASSESGVDTKES